jgi:hypothetical protein
MSDFLTVNTYHIGFKASIQTTHQNSFIKAGKRYHSLLGNHSTYQSRAKEEENSF